MPPKKRASPRAEKPRVKRPISKRRQNRERSRRRKLREEKAPGRGITKVDRRAIFLRFGVVCLKCGSKSRIVLDHVISLYAGGWHDPSNLQPLCWDCNTMKGWQGTEDYRTKPYLEGVHQSLVAQINSRMKAAKDRVQIKRAIAKRAKDRRSKRAG